MAACRDRARNRLVDVPGKRPQGVPQWRLCSPAASFKTLRWSSQQNSRLTVTSWARVAGMAATRDSLVCIPGGKGAGRGASSAITPVWPLQSSIRTLERSATVSGNSERVSLE